MSKEFIKTKFPKFSKLSQEHQDVLAAELERKLEFINLTIEAQVKAKKL